MNDLVENHEMPENHPKTPIFTQKIGKNFGNIFK